MKLVNPFEDKVYFNPSSPSLSLSLPFFISWVFGSFLCKAYHFIHSLSYTASIFILVVICMERYLAIQHPITSKQILTSSRLRVSIVVAVEVSALAKILRSKLHLHLH
jgi:7 transmembrane receptor (rhodopsin family)